MNFFTKSIIALLLFVSWSAKNASAVDPNDSNLPPDPAFGNMPSQQKDTPLGVDNSTNPNAASLSNDKGFYDSTESSRSNKNGDSTINSSSMTMFINTEKNEPLGVYPQDEDNTYVPSTTFERDKEKTTNSNEDLLNEISSNSRNDDSSNKRLVAKTAAEGLLNRGNDLISKAEKIEGPDAIAQIENFRNEFYDYSGSIKKTMDDKTRIIYFDYEMKIFTFVYEKLNNLEREHKVLDEKKLDLYSEFLDKEKGICSWQKKDGYFDPDNYIFSKKFILDYWQEIYGKSFTSNWQKTNFLHFANLLEEKIEIFKKRAGVGKVKPPKFNYSDFVTLSNVQTTYHSFFEAYAAGFALANKKMGSKKFSRRWSDSYEAFREASDMADTEQEKKVSLKWSLCIIEMSQKDLEEASKGNYDFDPLDGKDLVYEPPGGIKKQSGP